MNLRPLKSRVLGHSGLQSEAKSQKKKKSSSHFELKTLIGAGAKTQLVVRCLECTQLWVQSPIAQKLYMMVHSYDFSTQEVQARPGAQGSFLTQRSKPARAIGNPVFN